MDQEGRPALVAHELGKGKVLLSAYPLEQYLAPVSAVFDKSENTHLIYESLRQWACLNPPFRTDSTSVEVGTLTAGTHGYAVLVNHSPEPRNTTVTTTLKVHSLAQIEPDGSHPLELDGSTWKLTVQPYSGAVVEWK